MRLSAIVAMSENRVIGKDNQLPWHLPADLQHFKRVTLGKPIIMGRKTFQSIGRALPERRNIVLSTDPAFQAVGCIMVNSITDVFAAIADAEEAFVIGGATLFEQLLPEIQHLYLTIVHAELSGDVFFPQLNREEWQEVSRVDHPADLHNLHAYSFIVLHRMMGYK